MKKKLIALVLAVTVLVGAIVGGTLAYLSDVDSAVNVATVGNVKIKQYEMQRAEDGSYETYVQGQKLYPAYPANGEASYTVADGFWSKDLVGTMDKIVYVENTGRSDLYFRTWVAFECPTGLDYEKDIIANLNTKDYTWTEAELETIDGVEYAVVCGTYKTALAPKTTSPASLKQVVMHHTVGNDKVEACGETYEILVFSQAVQTENMPSVAAALEVAFDGYELPWVKDQAAAAKPVFVDTAEGLAEAVKAGKNIALTSDVEFDYVNSYLDVAKGASVELNLNGHNITATSSASDKNQNAFVVKGELEVTGNGSINIAYTGANMGWGNSFSAFSVEGGVLTLGEGVTVTNAGGTNMSYGVDVNSTDGASTLNIEGAKIYSTYTGVRIFNNHKTAIATVNFESGVIAGNSRDIWAQNPSASAVDTNAVVNIADSYDYTVEVQTASYNGRIYRFDDSVLLISLDETAANDSKTVLLDAIENVEDGGTVVLAGPAKIAGYDATKKLIVEKNVTIDLNGQTLVTECGWAGIDLKNGASIKNGVINHTGNTAAIKVFNAGSIENVVINVTETAGKTKTGIAVQQGGHVDAIKNVTIVGAQQGIEVPYQATVDVIENVDVTAVANGNKQGNALIINGGSVGKVVNSTLNGENCGVYMHVKGAVDVAVEFENCVVTGGDYALLANDEAHDNSGCTFTLVYDEATVFNGKVETTFNSDLDGKVTITKK